MIGISTMCPGCAGAIRVPVGPAKVRCRRCEATLYVTERGETVLRAMPMATRPALRRRTALDEARTALAHWAWRWEVYVIAGMIGAALVLLTAFIAVRLLS